MTNTTNTPPAGDTNISDPITRLCITSAIVGGILALPSLIYNVTLGLLTFSSKTGHWMTNMPTWVLQADWISSLLWSPFGLTNTLLYGDSGRPPKPEPLFFLAVGFLLTWTIGYARLFKQGKTGEARPLEAVQDYAKEVLDEVAPRCYICNKHMLVVRHDVSFDSRDLDMTYRVPIHARCIRFNERVQRE